MNIKGLSKRMRTEPYAALSLCAFAVSAYLCLVNLDYAALWHDEAFAAFFGKTLLQQGDIVGWGRAQSVWWPQRAHTQR